MMTATVSGAVLQAGARRLPALVVSLMLHGGLLALCTWTIVAQPPIQMPIKVTLLGAPDAGGRGGPPAPPAAPAPAVAPQPPANPVEPLATVRAKPKQPALAQPKPPVAPARRRAAAPPAHAAQEAAAPVSDAPASGGGSGGGGGSSGGGGDRPGVAGDPSGSALASYLGRLRGRLEAVKRYPALARRRGSIGTATLHIVIGRDGRPAAVTLQHSSGSELLDDEATEMVTRAAPFDPIPAELAGETLQITVPVRFDVNS